MTAVIPLRHILKPAVAEVVTREEELGSGLRFDAAIRNRSRGPVALERVGFAFDLFPDAVLEHGYQSWSVVRRCRSDDVRPERRQLPDWVRGMYQADPDAAGRSVQGDQFLLTVDGIVGFLDARRHLSTVEARTDAVVAWALLDGLVLEPGEERELDPLWVAGGDPGRLYSEYAGWWGAEMEARVSAPAPVAWCSWYHYFTGVTPSDLRANLGLAAEHDLDVVQLDDGYQAAIGDWLTAGDPWPGGTATVAEEVRATGLRAGIWSAPALVGENSALLTAHPDWVTVHDSGKPSRAMYNPAYWGGWAFALDTTRPEVLDHLRSTYAALRAQGFEYHKIDFCYAAALSGRRHNPRLTRAEALRATLEAVRDGIGNDAFLVGCGCPLAPAVGVVDAMRVSADVAPRWLPELSWAGYEESGPAARNAIIGSTLRAPLHRRLFINDPDCVLLRRTASELTADQIRLLTEAVAAAGAFTVLSDDLALYGDREWAIVRWLREQASERDQALDIVDPFARVINVSGREVDWD